jgi:DNA polymerase III subunit gamma/tau
MAWQRKHRPKQIKELHLTEVRESFQQMMKQGNFPQVLLFAGPKGTGKTSASRIIGNLLNDPKNEAVVEAVFFGKKKPKNKQLKEPDTDSKFAQRIYNGNSYVVQEMDAASYRGIDDVRSLKERAMLPPQEGRIAVYILDEAHMFTTEAFNALLKLLEEPPAHAVFILATTELHKIPETIVSRSSKVDFRKATREELLASLRFVADQESLEYDEEALTRLADRADGSFRDAVKLLEMVAQDGSVSLKSVAAILGENVNQFISQLIEHTLSKEPQLVAEVIDQLRTKNIQEQYFYKSLFTTLHRSLMQSLKAEPGEPMVSKQVAKFLLRELLGAELQQPSPIPFLALELKLLEVIERAQNQNNGQAAGKKKIKKPAETNSADLKTPLTTAHQPTQTVLSSEALLDDGVDDFASVQDLEKLSQSLLEQWEQFLQIVQRRNATLAALLRSSKLLINSEGVPQVGVYYKFHQEQLQQRKYMTLLRDCAKDVVGELLPIEVALQQAPHQADLVEMKENDQDLSTLAEEALL